MPSSVFKMIHQLYTTFPARGFPNGLKFSFLCSSRMQETQQTQICQASLTQKEDVCCQKKSSLACLERKEDWFRATRYNLYLVLAQ